MNAGQENPFSPRTVLGLLLFGAVAFIALLWSIGAGLTTGDANDGGGHAEGRGLNGYAAMARYLDKRGYAVSRVRSLPALDEIGRASCRERVCLAV